MKKTLKSIAGATCFASIILAGCETPDDGGICLPWTLGFIALAVISGYAYKRLEGRANG